MPNKVEAEEKQVAEENASKSKKQKPKKSKPKKTKPWLFLILLVLLGVLIVLYRKPLKQFMAYATKDIPLLNPLFASALEEEDPYAQFTKEDLISQLEKKEKDLLTQEEALKSLQKENNLLTEKITALKSYEEKFEAFRIEKAEWDLELAKEDTQEYIKFYEQIYPEEARKIYETLKTEVYLTKIEKELAQSVAEMDESSAAKALERLLVTDTQLVRNILESMDTEGRALILSEMDASAAAQAIKLLSVETQNLQ